MKKISTIGFALLLIIGMVSCGNSQDKNANSTVQTSASIAKNVNATQFQEMMESKEGVVVLDVRTLEEVAAGAIEGSTALDFYGANFKQSLEAMDKNKPVLVYCAVGSRSGNAMQTMQKMGFKEVYNLSGGIRAWQSEGKPVK